MFRLYRQARAEINELPPAGQYGGPKHAMLGASLKSAITLPDSVQGVAAIVQFAAPGCPLCSEELAYLERSHRKQPFPYVCLYESDLEEHAQKFLADFGHLHIQPITKETMQLLGVVATPLVVMIDADGVVRQVEIQMAKILPSIQSAKRRAG
ncbi:redoxin family protein [Tumebacillus sp. BK434]|uniref:redoxin family protein n=1 Tax=Tumebacillus sp. BK434 TaxID=2512169 RepID=UPI001405553E|nr:redoxin family protein [Tumebacillus sp. BK434]